LPFSYWPFASVFVNEDNQEDLQNFEENKINPDENGGEENGQ
jgi:hypothetical protein